MENGLTIIAFLTALFGLTILSFVISKVYTNWIVTIVAIILTIFIEYYLLIFLSKTFIKNETKYNLFLLNTEYFTLIQGFVLYLITYILWLNEI